MVEVLERGIWEQQGFEADNSLVVLLVVVRVREERGEEGGSERERRMRQGMEGQRGVEELLELWESQGGELEKQSGKMKVGVSFRATAASFIQNSHKNSFKHFLKHNVT